MSRIILGFSSFVCLICIGVTGYIIVTNDSPKLKNLVTGLKPKKNNVVFYKTVGDAPKRTVEEGLKKSASMPQKRFTLELEVTNNQTKADIILDNLQERGIEAYYTPIQKAGKVYYHIRQGLFSDRLRASKEAKKVLNKRNIEAKIIALK